MPGTPAVPGTPCGPGAPCTPGVPAGPGAPCGPYKPGAPLKPAAPGDPLNPGMPGIPASPSCRARSCSAWPCKISNARARFRKQGRGSVPGQEVPAAPARPRCPSCPCLRPSRQCRARRPAHALLATLRSPRAPRGPPLRCTLASRRARAPRAFPSGPHFLPCPDRRVAPLVPRTRRARARQRGQLARRQSAPGIRHCEFAPIPRSRDSAFRLGRSGRARTSPGGPGSPRSPVYPGRPVSPAAPFSPARPLGPWDPGLPPPPSPPSAPASPTGPSEPLSPCAPGGLLPVARWFRLWLSSRCAASTLTRRTPVGRLKEEQRRSVGSEGVGPVRAHFSHRSPRTHRPRPPVESIQAAGPRLTVRSLRPWQGARIFCCVLCVFRLRSLIFQIGNLRFLKPNVGTHTRPPVRSYVVERANPRHQALNHTSEVSDCSHVARRGAIADGRRHSGGRRGIVVSLPN